MRKTQTLWIGTTDSMRDNKKRIQELETTMRARVVDGGRKKNADKNDTDDSSDGCGGMGDQMAAGTSRCGADSKTK